MTTPTKDFLRDELHAAREALSPARREQASTAIAARILATHLNPGVVFVYCSTSEEVATRSLIDELLLRGNRILVPRVVDRQTMHAVEFPGWSHMRPGTLGILSPEDTTPFGGEVDLAIVPGLGFSRRGDRLGYGAGYYDRWFDAHPGSRRWGVAFDVQIVADLPVEAHDIRMQRIVTDEQSIDCE